MQLILKPISEPELGEIIVNDSLFAIGRHEEPFAGYDSRFVTRLSRRHARIFEQDGMVYLADLGSLNGTRVNGQAVDKIPVRLRPGAEVCFAGLCYQIEILGAAVKRESQGGRAAPAMLVLKPEHPESPLEPIVINQFPFLVNKKSEVFARYSEQLPDQLKYLSRRHAHIFLRNDSLYIEDLGSTNGTYVSGARLEEHAHLLSNGDVVAFGGECFVYRVELVYEDTEAPQQGLDPTHVATRIQGIEDVTRTTFVTSANSFLDIFCIDDAGGDNEPDAAPPPAEGEGEAFRAEAAASGPARGWLASLGRVRSSLREVRSALVDDTPKRPRRLWPAGLLLIAVVGGATAVYLRTAPQRNISNLMELGDYQQAAVAANAYLETHRKDREVGDLATEALLKAIGPSWTKLVMTADFAAAREMLDSGKRWSSFNASAAPLLDSMQWVTDMEEFIAGRGGPGAPIAMFDEEDKVNALLAWWENDPNARHRSLDSIARDVPEFVELRSRAFSHQRVLQSHKALEFAAIDRLRETLEDKLQAGKAGELTAVLADFENRYPDIKGTAKLNSDLNRYLPIEAQIKSHDWLQASESLSAADFQTPPFRARAGLVAVSLLPGEDVVARYRQASEAWREGDFDQANSLLQELSATRWAEPAERQLQRNARISRDYAQLQAARGTRGYEEQLLAFYSALDPQHDSWFIQALKGEFDAHREKALTRAQQAFEEARASWAKYRDKGGIRALQRLEAGVSPSFRSLAKLLSEAWRDISYGKNLYSLLDTRYPAQWDELYAQVADEVALQRRSLAELSMVLEPSLKQAKLRLIPVLPAGQQSGRTEGTAPGTVDSSR
jgi:pSer/pThr/pTyr-binding forkhead associated (FHA) protein